MCMLLWPAIQLASMISNARLRPLPKRVRHVNLAIVSAGGHPGGRAVKEFRGQGQTIHGGRMWLGRSYTSQHLVKNCGGALGVEGLRCMTYSISTAFQTGLNCTPSRRTRKVTRSRSPGVLHRSRRPRSPCVQESRRPGVQVSKSPLQI